MRACMRACMRARVCVCVCVLFNRAVLKKEKGIANHSLESHAGLAEVGKVRLINKIVA